MSDPRQTVETAALASAARRSRDERATSASGWILLGICPAAFVSVLNSFALGPFLPAIGRELEVSVAVLGQVPGAVSALAAVLGLALGPVADRYGHRRTLLLGLLAGAISAIGAGAAPTISLLLLATMVGAVGRAVVTPVSLAIVGTHFAGRQARRAMSYVVTALSGSAVLGIPALTLSAVVADTWRGAFAVLGLATLAVVLVAALVLPRQEPHLNRGEGGHGMLRVYGPLLGHGPTLGVVGSSFLRSGAGFMIFLYWGAFLIEYHGLDVTAAGVGYSAAGLGHGTGSLIAGRWLGEARTRPFMLLFTTLAGLTLSATILAPLGPVVAIALGTCAFMMIGGVEVATAMLLSSETPGGRATTMTLNSSAMSLGGGVGSAIGGLLLGLGGYAWLGIGAPILAMTSALVLWVSRPRMHR